MPEKVKIRLEKVVFDKEAAIPTSGKARFKAEVSGGGRTRRLKPSEAAGPDDTARTVTAGGTYTLNWEAEIDVTDVAAITFKVEAHDGDPTKHPSQLGVVTLGVRTQKPYELATGAISPASDPPRFKVVYDVKLTGAAPPEGSQPEEIFTTRQHATHVTATTVSNATKAVHMEFHPVSPTPTTGLPTRPPAADAEDNADPGATIAHDSALNIIPNPAVIPILAPPQDPPNGGTYTNTQLDGAGWANKRNIAIIKCTWYCPKVMNFTKSDQRLEWKVTPSSGGPTVKFYDKDGYPGNHGTQVGVYATGDTEGQVVLEVHFKNTVLTKYRALVRRIRKVPCRFNILKVTGNAADSPKCAPADLVKHLAITNRYLRQGGIELTLDTSTDTTDGATATAVRGIFTINVLVGKTKNATDTRAREASAMNYQENVINIVYIHSQADPGGLGLVTANPGEDDGPTISDSGNPSSSWKSHSGVQYVDPPGGAKPHDTVADMKLFAAEPYQGTLLANTAAQNAVRMAKNAWVECRKKGVDSESATEARQAYIDANSAYNKLKHRDASDKDRAVAQRELRAAHDGAKGVREKTTNAANLDNAWNKAKEAATKAEDELRAAYKVTKPGLGAMVITGVNGNPSTDPAKYGNTIPHEIGHILCLRHRIGAGPDGIGYPPDQNLMHGTNPATLAQDIDVIQVKGMDRSPLVNP